MAEGRLFSGGRLGEWLEARWRKLQTEIDQLSESELLAVDAEACAEELAAGARVEPVVLGGPELEDLGETQVDVSQDTRRFIRDRSRPIFVPGHGVAIHIPLLAGDSAILDMQPSRFTYSPPRAAVTPDAVTKSLRIPAGREDFDIRAEADALHRDLSQWLEFGRPQIEEFNDSLPTRARAAIEERRRRILSRHDLLARTGLPLRRRADAPRTYRVPGVTRRPRPTRPPSSAARPAHLEPVMAEDFFEHVLSVIRAGARGIERARQSFTELREEDLRHLFLFTLNTHYEGSATGEAFNAEGKTDILVRVADRNVFIGECKIWKGVSGFQQTIDQLFGYTTWHDTKVALIMFVRQKGLTNVIAKAREALETHQQFAAWREAPEGELRCSMAWPGDPERTVDLSVIFVHLAVSSEQPE